MQNKLIFFLFSFKKSIYYFHLKLITLIFLNLSGISNIKTPIFCKYLITSFDIFLTNIIISQFLQFIENKDLKMIFTIYREQRFENGNI